MKPAHAPPIGTVIPGVLKQVQRRQEALLRIQRHWGKLVGKPLALHSKPVRLRAGRLIVHVAHPGEGFALSYERERLLSRLKKLTEGRVEELVIRPGEL